MPNRRRPPAVLLGHVCRGMGLRAGHVLPLRVFCQKGLIPARSGHLPVAQFVTG